MGRVALWAVGIAAAAAIFAWHFYFKPGRHLEPAPPPPVIEPAPQPAPAAPPPPEAPPAFTERTPEVEEEIPAVLPELEDSDESVFDRLTALAGDGAASRLAEEGVIRSFVVTVDNLPREIVSMKVRAVRPTPDRFGVEVADEIITMSPANYTRYATLVELLTRVDPEGAVDAYIWFYPLMQEAFVDLGYPDRQFHNRFIEVIDHLLATPEVAGPIRLTQPHVLYQYADPTLESRSAGQKMMLRIGPDHAARVKEWLGRFKTALAGRVVPQVEQG